MKSILIIATLIFSSAVLARAPGQVAHKFEKPEQAVAAFWRALQNEPGKSSDSTTLNRLFHKDAIFFWLRERDGVASLTQSAASEYIQKISKPGEEGFYECEVKREVKVYDRFATVYSIVESRVDARAAQPKLTGINSIQLYKDVDEWKIISVYYHIEKKGYPIPLDGGVSGKCIE
jgi:hypothetical protein